MKKLKWLLAGALILGLAIPYGYAAEKVTYPISGLGLQVKTKVKAKKKYVIACVVKNSTNPYMVKQLEGLKKAGKDMGFEPVVLAPAKQDSIEEQVRIIEDLLQRGIDALVVHPSDSNGIVPAVEKAVAKNVPVVTIGTPANSDKPLFRTGVDYTETGAVIGEWIAKKLKGKGNVIVLEGPPQAQNARERNAGISESLAKYPGIKILASQPANFQRLMGMQVMENLLQKYNKVDAVIAANDESALGAVMAIKAAGRSEDGILVAGFDGNEDASWAIKKGQMAVSYNTDPISSAYCAAAYLVQYLNDGSKPPAKFLPYPSALNKPLITKDNIDSYISKFAWWK